MNEHAIGVSGPPAGGPLSGLAANYTADNPQASPLVNGPKSNVIHTFVHSSLWIASSTVAPVSQACMAVATVSIASPPGCVSVFRPVSRSMASHRAAGRDAAPDDDGAAAA